MPAAPRPVKSEATKIALQILGRMAPKKGPKTVPSPVGPMSPPKGFDGGHG
jgi:hypothetical protein